MEEIRKGLTTATRSGAKDIVLMHGVQNFPTEISSLNVKRLTVLQNEFPGMPVGYADHTSGDNGFSKSVDLLAIALGASLLEKHICLDRKAKGLDYRAILKLCSCRSISSAAPV